MVPSDGARRSGEETHSLDIKGTDVCVSHQWSPKSIQCRQDFNNQWDRWLILWVEVSICPQLPSACAVIPSTVWPKKQGAYAWVPSMGPHLRAPLWTSLPRLLKASWQNQRPMSIPWYDTILQGGIWLGFMAGLRYWSLLPWWATFIFTGVDAYSAYGFVLHPSNASTYMTTQGFSERLVYWCSHPYNVT